MEFFTPVGELTRYAWNFSQRLLTAIIIFVIGWIIAKIIKSLVVKVLKVLRIDSIAEQAKIADFLAKGGIKYTLSEIIGVIIYWILILGVLISSLNILALVGVSNLLDRIVTYLPNVIGALIILVLGSFISVFVASVIRTAAANVGLGEANLLSKIAQALIVVFAVVVALDLLNIGRILVSAMNIVLATIGLALALAFGLGCKEIAAKNVAELIDKLKSKK